MRVIVAALVVLAIPVALDGIDGVRKGPDLDDLFTRVSGSVYVAKVRVLESKGAGGYTFPVFGLTDENRIKELLKIAIPKIGEERAMEMIRNAARSEPLDEKEREGIVRGGGAVLMDTDPGGILYKLALDQIVCRQSDFLVGSARNESPSGPVYIFVPFQETPARSTLDRGRFLRSEYMQADGEYLLFLRQGPPSAALAARYGLDPNLTYYRAYEGHRGAVRLPDAAHPEEPDSFVTPLVSAVTTLCNAAESPDVETKIRNLNAIRGHSTDPAWRQSVDAAIRDFERQKTPQRE